MWLPQPHAPSHHKPSHAPPPSASPCLSQMTSNANYVHEADSVPKASKYHLALSTLITTEDRSKQLSTIPLTNPLSSSHLGHRIGQIVFAPIIHPQLTSVQDLESSIHDTGGFGSTGTKSRIKKSTSKRAYRSGSSFSPILGTLTEPYSADASTQPTTPPFKPALPTTFKQATPSPP